MFQALDSVTPPSHVTLDVDGRSIQAAEGSTLAIALLRAGIHATRSDHRGEPRAPYCLMGVCFECQVQVDGQDHVQSCMVRVEAGMRVRLAHGPRELDAP